MALVDLKLADLLHYFLAVHNFLNQVVFLTRLLWFEQFKLPDVEQLLLVRDQVESLCF